MTTIKLKNGSGAPTAGDLAQGEPALDLTNKRLYTEDSGGTVIEVGTNPGTDVTFADNRKAVFGAGSDLQIYHDGANSYVTDAGTGDLRLSANNLRMQNADNTVNYIKANNGSNVELFFNNASKLATTSTGIDVTGTVTADGLTLQASEDVVSWASGNGIVQAPSNLYVRSSGTGDVLLQSDSTAVAKFEHGGDISFYEDTGTTAKLFWDASAESLGIGTSSPVSELDVAGTTPTLTIKDTQNKSWTSSDTTLGELAFRTSDTSGIGAHNVAFVRAVNEIASGTTPSGALSFGVSTSNTNASEAMRIDQSGNVGIGTSSPVFSSGYSGLQVNGGTAAQLRLTNSTTGATATDGLAVSNDVSASYLWNYESTPLILATASTERMRIDSSGNLLVGVTNMGSAGLSILNSMNFNVSEGANSSFVNIFRQSSSAATVVANGYKYSDTANKMASSYASLWAKSAMALNYGNVIFYTDGATTTAVGTDVTPTERMRIDSNGNLLVGKTSSSFNTAGIEARSGGTLWATADGTNAASFNRKTSDGAIALFSKDGSTVGSIGTKSADLCIGTDDTGIRFGDGGNSVIPHNMTTNVTSDGVINFGTATERFKDLYLSGGVYLGGTSNANKLDDYEEGTFTPVMTGVSGWDASANGYYRKVGSLVTVVIYFSSNSALTGTPSNTITGLPFSNVVSERSSNVSISRMFGVDLTSSDYIAGVSGTSIDFGSVGGGNTVNNFTVSGSTLRFTVSATYITA